MTVGSRTEVRQARVGRAWGSVLTLVSGNILPWVAFGLHYQDALAVRYAYLHPISAGWPRRMRAMQQ